MAKLNLRMTRDEAAATADAIDQLLDLKPDHPDATRLTGVAAWLHYRVTIAAITPPDVPAG